LAAAKKSKKEKAAMILLAQTMEFNLLRKEEFKQIQFLYIKSNFFYIN